MTGVRKVSTETQFSGHGQVMLVNILLENDLRCGNDAGLA